MSKLLSMNMRGNRYNLTTTIPADTDAICIIPQIAEVRTPVIEIIPGSGGSGKVAAAVVDSCMLNNTIVFDQITDNLDADDWTEWDLGTVTAKSQYIMASLPTYLKFTATDAALKIRVNL